MIPFDCIVMDLKQCGPGSRFVSIEPSKHGRMTDSRHHIGQCLEQMSALSGGRNGDELTESHHQVGILRHLACDQFRRGGGTQADDGDQADEQDGGARMRGRKRSAALITGARTLNSPQAPIPT